MVLPIKSVDEILKCDHSNESFSTGFPEVLFIMLYRVLLTFEFADEILKCEHSNESYRKILPWGTSFLSNFQQFCISNFEF